LEALRLREENGLRGNVYRVNEIAGIPVNHAYYVPDDSDLFSFALNQEDNGFPDKPALPVWLVLKHGIKYTGDGI
jgi:hypothetical protein